MPPVHFSPMSSCAIFSWSLMIPGSSSSRKRSRRKTSGRSGLVASRRPLTVPDIGNALRAQFGQDLADVADRDGHAVVTVTPARYRELITVLRDDPEFDCDYFDFLTGVDFPEQNGMELVVHVYSNARTPHVRVKVRINRAEPVAPTIHDIYPGAN